MYVWLQNLNLIGENFFKVSFFRMGFLQNKLMIFFILFQDIIFKIWIKINKITVEVDKIRSQEEN